MIPWTIDMIGGGGTLFINLTMISHIELFTKALTVVDQRGTYGTDKVGNIIYKYKYINIVYIYTYIKMGLCEWIDWINDGDHLLPNLLLFFLTQLLADASYVPA